MFRTLRLAAVAAFLSLLAGCGAPLHPINPPSASIQQLDVLPDGRWKLQIRIENFSDKTQHYTTFKADLRVSGVAAGALSLNPDFDVPGENADIVETTFAPSADAAKAFAGDVKEPNGAPYELKGTITIPVPPARTSSSNTRAGFRRCRELRMNFAERWSVGGSAAADANRSSRTRAS
jgi:hypothetical protein